MTEARKLTWQALIEHDADSELRVRAARLENEISYLRRAIDEAQVQLDESKEKLSMVHKEIRDRHRRYTSE